jgi:chemotaxis protein MotB
VLEKGAGQRYPVPEMGKNPWEDSDVDLAAFRKRSGGKTSWSKVFAWILVVAALTFVAAYYVPLHRAHKALVSEFRALVEQRRVSEEKLPEARRQLDQESKEKQRLKAEAEERQAQEKSAESRLGEVSKKLAGLMGESVSNGDAKVAILGDAVHVTLANDLVFKPHTLTITEAQSKRLCEIAQASSGALRLTALAKENEPPSVLLKAKYPTPRALSAARAATAAADLESHCQVKSQELQASSVVYADAPGGTKLPALRIELLSKKDF